MSRPVLRSKRLGMDFELAEGLVTAGRHQESDIRIDGSHFNQVSRRHLEIRVKQGHVEICDVSTHGTLVNGKEIQGWGWIPLQHRDLVQLCGADGVDLQFVDPQAANSGQDSHVVPN